MSKHLSRFSSVQEAINYTGELVAPHISCIAEIYAVGHSPSLEYGTPVKVRVDKGNVLISEKRVPPPHDNEIFYTTTDASIVTPHATSDLNSYLSNTYDNGIGLMEFSSDIKYIDENSFRENTKLKSIILPNNITYIGSRAFEYCTNLESVALPQGVDSISDYAFSNTGLTSIVIPNSVTFIGNGAFSNTGLTSIVIPNSVTFIGNGAFSNTRLTSIVIPDSITRLRQLFAFCSSLANVVIPQSVTYIEGFAFEECGRLTDITFNGTIAQWQEILIDTNWAYASSITTIHCTDGDISL